MLAVLGESNEMSGEAASRARLTLPGMQVVDVGMGTGLVSREILKITNEPQRLVGVERHQARAGMAVLVGPDHHRDAARQLRARSASCLR